MKLYYFFGCILATASLAVWPEIGLAHGGGGGGGGHGFGGGGGGHAFFRGGGHAFGGFTGRPGFSGTRVFATGRFSGRGDHGRFGDRGFRGRDRDFRDHRRFFVGFDFVGFGFPYWWYPDYYYYGDYGYPYEDGSYDNSPVYDYRYWYGLASAVQTNLARRGYYHGPIDGVIGFASREAIRTFQRVQGLPATGLIDPALLKALKLPAVPGLFMNLKYLLAGTVSIKDMLIIYEEIATSRQTGGRLAWREDPSSGSRCDSNNRL